MSRNGGAWTESRFHSFIKSALRAASMKWPPKNEVKKKARVKRGVYICADCKQQIANTIVLEGKRVKNVFVDHIRPVIDPYTGFTTWDEVIERMFCEEEHLQLLCKKCHEVKTAEERQIAKERKKNA